MRTITFNELRKIKDSLPSGSMHRIADELGLHVDTVRNFFGGHNFKEGKSVGIHLEPGPDGGLVMLDDTTVLDRALKILDELNMSMQKEQLPNLCKFKIQQTEIPIALNNWDFLFVHLQNVSIMEDKLVTLAILTYTKAQILKNVLENEGIETYIHNVNQIQPVVSSGVRLRI